MNGKDLKYDARQLMRDYSPKVFLVAVIFLILNTIMGHLQINLLGTADVYARYMQLYSAAQSPYLISSNPVNPLSFFRPSGIPFALALSLFTSMINIGYRSYCLLVSRKSEADYKNLFDGFMFFGKAVILDFLINILVILWTALLVVPGIIASYNYRMAYYILLDDPSKSALQCIRESKQLMRGYKSDLFIIDLSFIGWSLLDAVVIFAIPTSFPLPLVSIWLTPYIHITEASFYNRLIYSLTV